MASYQDLLISKQKIDNLDDDLKDNDIDIALPVEDYNSGWTYLAKGASITITHNFGRIPRLKTLLKNTTASDANAYDIGTLYLNTATGFSILNLDDNRLTIKNHNTANAYFKLLLWK